MEDLVERIKKNEEKIKRALIRKGKKEGQKESLIAIARKLLNQNMPIEQIISITDLEKEEILKLKNT